MSLKIYTITQDGSSNGNVILQPFTIEVSKISYQSTAGFEDNMTVESRCLNSSFDQCENDNINSSEVFELPPMSSSNNANLSSFEDLLESVYPGKWS